MRVSKKAQKLHTQAMELVNSTRDLTIDERLFILNNYNPMIDSNVGASGAFFTPVNLASDLTTELDFNADHRIIDLCAGIGMLTFMAVRKCEYTGYLKDTEFICFERNEKYARVGKRVVPEATWICGDMFDEDAITNLGKFDVVLSNPPYGIKDESAWLHKGLSQFKAAEVAMKISDRGIFIVPQGNCPFNYSGKRQYTEVSNQVYEKWHKATGIEFNMNSGIDTSYCSKEWVGLNNMHTEIIIVTKGAS